MKKALLFLCISCFALALSAQRVKKSTGEYQINLTRSDFSEAEACQKCQEIAMIEAIEKQFGRVILQGNSTYIENTNTGEKVETNQIFNVIAETYVNGEWIETLEESCDRFIDNGDFWVKCQVKGKVREMVAPKLDLVAKTLDCESKTCITTEFVDGESFYLYFKSPIDGYLTVYIGDAEMTQRLLPYRQMPKGMLNGVKVKADEEYILFSSREDQLELGPYVEEYEFYTESDVDQNRLYVIYSKDPLVKPSLYRNPDQGAGEMPMQLPIMDFQKWLAQQRRYNTDMQVLRLDVTIKK
ncbi:MAG: hypothetical protein AAFQ83_24115 [Bacteroidota bacterium]